MQVALLQLHSAARCCATRAAPTLLSPCSPTRKAASCTPAFTRPHTDLCIITVSTEAHLRRSTSRLSTVGASWAAALPPSAASSSSSPSSAVRAMRKSGLPEPLPIAASASDSATKRGARRLGLMAGHCSCHVPCDGRGSKAARWRSGMRVTAREVHCSGC